MPRALSEPTERLLLNLERLRAPSQIPIQEGGEELISVSDLTRSLGFFYEKIRNTLDYREEALWAKNATYRALKRRFHVFLAGENVGRSLIEELIRGRYLESNSLPESKADEVDQILTKYRMLFYHAFQGQPQKEVAEGEEDWWLELAASEIGEALRDYTEDKYYIAYMYESVSSLLKVAPEIKTEDLDLQLYLTSFRTLLQADPGMESYVVFKLIEPAWTNASADLIAQTARNMAGLRARIGNILASPLREKLDQIFKRRLILIHLLRDMIESNPEHIREIFTDPERLESTLKEFYEKRYQENRTRLQRSGTRAVIFLFITKMFLAIGIEVPYELFQTHGFNLVALAINTAFPPLLLLLTAVAIRMPGEEKNFVKLVMDFSLITSAPDPAHQVYLDALRPDRKRHVFTKVSLGILYIFNFALTFSLLLWVFRKLHYHWLSATIFIFFLSLVAFFALRLRKTANELTAIEEGESYVKTFIDFLGFPIVEIGRLLTKGLSSINFAAFIFDFFIEAPFHAFVAILEEWVTFMKERRKSL